MAKRRLESTKAINKIEKTLRKSSNIQLAEYDPKLFLNHTGR